MRECVSDMGEQRTNSEFKVWLKARTRKFAVEVFRLLDILPKCASTQVIPYQLGKSSSSMGANYREATRAVSGADFFFKIGLCEKEADESLFWMDVLADLYTSSHCLARQTAPLLSESDELLRIFVSISKTNRDRKLTPSSSSKTAQ